MARYHVTVVSGDPSRTAAEAAADAGAEVIRKMSVPDGVAARIRTRMALGSAQVDQNRFPATATGYESPDFATAANQVEIDVNGGVGSFRVTGSGA